MFSSISYFFFSSRRRHTRYIGDWSSDVCSSDLPGAGGAGRPGGGAVLPGGFSGAAGEVEPRRPGGGLRAGGAGDAAGGGAAGRGLHRGGARSEERRVGKERRARGGRDPCTRRED